MASSKTPITRGQEISFEVKFFVDCDPADGSALFKAGKVYELPASSANRWIRRNKAEKYVPPPPKPKLESKKPPAPKRTYTRRTTTAIKTVKASPQSKSTAIIPEEKKTPAGAFPEAEPTTDS